METPEDVENLKDWVLFYCKHGFNIIPLKARSKEPLVKWTEFQKRKAADEELRGWFSKDDVNIGIVCGSVSGNLVVLDFESREAFIRFFEKTPEEMAESTLVVKTARGYHVYFRANKPLESFKIPRLQLDVKSEGGYVVAPPSIHPNGSRYEFLGDPWKLDHLQNIDDLDEWIWLRAGELGIFRYGSEEDPPCIRMLLNGVSEGVRNESAIRLVSYWIQFRKLEPRAVFNRLVEWNVRNRTPMNEKELKSCLESVLKHGYEYGCSSMVELGLCNDRLKSMCNIKESLQVKKKHIRYAASAVLSDGRLIEEAYRDCKVFFIVYDPKTGGVSELEEVEDANTIYRPIYNQDVETGQVLLPSRAEEYGSDEQLFNDILTFLNHWHEQGDGWERVVDVLYVFQTWVYDVFPQVAYRRALGRYGSGKTAWLETMGHICYRGMKLAGCDSEASLRRTFDLWRGTALIDEADFSKSTLYANIIKVLNIGFSREMGWYRCCDENDPKKILSFSVYGPKLLATRNRFVDVAIESRCLSFVSMESSGEAPLFRAERFKKWTQNLRNKLLMWRFRNYNRIREEVAQLEKTGLFKEVFENGVEKRIAQIILPFLILFKDDKIADGLKKMAVQKTEELKNIDGDRWIEDGLRNILKKIFEEAEKGGDESKNRPLADVGKIAEDDSVNVVNEVNVVKEGGRVVLVETPIVKLVKELYGKDLDSNDRKKYSRKVSNILRDRYGVKIKVGAGNRRIAILDGGLLRKISGGYFNYINFINYFNSAEPTESLTEQSKKSKETGESREKPNELLLTEENFHALFEAVKSYGMDYWDVDKVLDEYARAGGRDFYRLVLALSSDEWLKTNPVFWLEQHPQIGNMFRLRRK